MVGAENRELPGADASWRTWLMTGARRAPMDRRRVRGSHKGLKKMLVEGMRTGGDPPYTWQEFSDAMVRQSVGEAMRSLPSEDVRLIKLAYFGGLSNRQLASQFGSTESTVQRRLRQALEKVSEHVERGRSTGRRLLVALGVWLSGRWLGDAMHHVVQAGVVLGAAAAIAAQPAPAVGSAPHAINREPATAMAAPADPAASAPAVRAHKWPALPAGSVVAPALPQLPAVAIQAAHVGVFPALRLPAVLPPVPVLTVRVKLAG
jgi:RNA polymerase sigma factor (sigma-70 family)